MTTAGQLVEQVNSHLHSFTGITEATTHLTSGITSSDLVVPVQHPTRITQGLIEIDDELLRVDTVGSTSVTVAPYGRAQADSIAATHATNAKVTNDPVFPRVRIFDALKRAILQVKPDLFTVTATTFLSSPVVTTYEIPAAAQRVLKVQYEEIGPSKEWRNIIYWTEDHNAATVSGKAIVIHGSIPVGRTVQVVYAGPFMDPAAMSTDLESGCSIPASMHDLLMWNACWQLIQFMEMARLDLSAVEQQARSQGIRVGDPSQIAKQVYAMYELRKSEERKRLLMNHPPVKRYSAR